MAQYFEKRKYLYIKQNTIVENSFFTHFPNSTTTTTTIYFRNHPRIKCLKVADVNNRVLRPVRLTNFWPRSTEDFFVGSPPHGTKCFSLVWKLLPSISKFQCVPYYTTVVCHPQYDWPPVLEAAFFNFKLNIFSFRIKAVLKNLLFLAYWLFYYKLKLWIVPDMVSYCGMDPTCLSVRVYMSKDVSDI